MIVKFSAPGGDVFVEHEHVESIVQPTKDGIPVVGLTLINGISGRQLIVEGSCEEVVQKIKDAAKSLRLIH